jgi:FAD/FMN-containing dehydrogenase
MTESDLLGAIEAVVGKAGISVDESDKVEFGRDWTKVFAPDPLAIVRPKTTDEVSGVLRLCNAANRAVVPSGGRTGLAGGAVAKDREIVLSLSRMNQMGPVDKLGASVTVEAGAVTQAVHEHCAKEGLTWPVDFASKGSSQIGGNIATNAGGIKVIRYGLTRNWVLGLDVVLADGSHLAMGRALEKNNTGPDLRQLFIGSEGTLGVITKATLKLTRLPEECEVFLFAVSGIPSVLRLFRSACEAPFTLQAFEFFTDKCLARVQRHRKVDNPLDVAAAAYVVMEIEKHPSSMGWLEMLFEQGLVQGGTMGQHNAQNAKLWELRESISESLSATGLPHKNDIALPVANLEAFCAQLEETIAAYYPGFEVCLFGHIGDGNLHVNVMKPETMDKAEFLTRTHELDERMFALVRTHDGSISAEHGIGLLKKDFLSFSRTSEELATMRLLKRAMDPNGILNPGKIFDA